MSVFKSDIFKGKVVFCTGGRSGICYEIVERMMSLGCSSAIVGRDAKGLAESASALTSSTSQACLPCPADVRDPKAMVKAVEDCINKFGKIDFVICGAAGNFLSPIEMLSVNAFRTVIEIDLLGTYNTIKATLPHVRSSKGSYVHISATLHYRGTPYQAHVSAAKAGVDALSNVLAVEEGPRGVRSNVIAPGPIGETTGMQRLGTKDGQNALEKEIPLGRMGKKGDIASMAVFLFSEEAAWISGQIFVVDGGHSHTFASPLPYPEAVLNPASFASLIDPRTPSKSSKL
ncbi:hypothetical protein BDY24DRAFT_387824 [Mrakia frigida]|uniref:SDR family oxidoreductase n=1 Tax=Mrakia frigida TaxID=29902 RepID=UPI003FCC1751